VVAVAAAGGGHSTGHTLAASQTAGGHSTGHSVVVVQTAGGRSTGHSVAVVGKTSGGRFAGSKAWTASPALVTLAAPALRSVSSSYCITCARDSNGRIARSEAAKREFMASTGYPHGRPGWVVDHIEPLKRGGADSPSNMQWQTKADAKAKDKWE